MITGISATICGTNVEFVRVEGDVRISRGSVLASKWDEFEATAKSYLKLMEPPASIQPPEFTPLDESGNDLSPPAKTIREQIEAVLATGKRCLIETREGTTELFRHPSPGGIYIYKSADGYNRDANGDAFPSRPVSPHNIVRVIGPAT